MVVLFSVVGMVRVVEREGVLGGETKEGREEGGGEDVTSVVLGCGNG